MALLDWMDFGLCYYNCEQGEPVWRSEYLRLAEQGEPARRSEYLRLVPVMGLHWRVSRDPDSATLYIKDRPYTFSSAWIRKQRQNEAISLSMDKFLSSVRGDDFETKEAYAMDTLSPPGHAPLA